LLDLDYLDNAVVYKSCLKSPFSSDAQAERYRTALNQLRQGALSLEQLDFKVRSLVSKAAPGPWKASTEIYARDAFMTALNKDLRRRIMMTCPPPETLSAVYSLALLSLPLCTDTAKRIRDDGDNRDSQSDRRYARAISDNPPTTKSQSARASSEARQLAEENRQMQIQLKEHQATLANSQTDFESGCRTSNSAAA
jgi:hypothetical protein